jgi:hypothetical protein
MEDSDVGGLAVLGEMAKNLPAPVSTGLLKAISGLLGGLPKADLGADAAKVGKSA